MTHSSELQSQVSRVTLRVTAATFAGVFAAALAACAPAELSPDSNAAASSSAKATPKPTETEAPTAEHEFSGTINLEGFTGEAWEEKDRIEKVDTCNEEFFAVNLPEDPVLTVSSSAQEIATVFGNRLDLVGDLAKDASDPFNLEAAKNIAECMTSDLTVNGDHIARNNLQSSLGTIAEGKFEGYELTYIKPEDITRHSDGLFAAQTNDTLYYDAFAIEGAITDNIGSMLQTQYYEWSPAEYQYTMMLTSSIDDADNKSHFGTKPPIVVDPSRAEAPAADF
ncbi:hypothetical protein AB2L57_07975 [Microbacterium sp. HA-8]|uniref:hypothetical protein n=1 Tax=Microbacterium sp. HA-8 TaxID=3234200 RepID=UPI0038F7B0F7